MLLLLLLLLLVRSQLGRVGGELGLGILGPGAGRRSSEGGAGLVSAAVTSLASTADAARPLDREPRRAHERPVKVLQRPQGILVGPEAHEAELAGAAVRGADDFGVGDDDLRGRTAPSAAAVVSAADVCEMRAERRLVGVSWQALDADSGAHSA